jgi:hypothetical protein
MTSARITGMGGHQRAGRAKEVWLTPPDILAALGSFDLDPCACPDPRPWPTAARHIAPPENGLLARWHGRVWLNPPYDQEAWRWLHRLAEHGRGVALIFARTETEGFDTAVWGRATGMLFLKGRLHFHYRDGRRSDTNSGAPSVLVAYGMDDAVRLQTCSLPGSFVIPQQRMAA